MTPLAIIAFSVCLLWALSAYRRERSQTRRGAAADSEARSTSTVQSHAGFTNQSSPTGL